MFDTEKAAKALRLTRRGVLAAASKCNLEPQWMGDCRVFTQADIDAMKGRNRKVGRPRKRGGGK